MSYTLTVPIEVSSPAAAFSKLRPLEPQFLFESVSQSGTPERFSFIGFGATDELRLTQDMLRGTQRSAALWPLREALGRAPLLSPSSKAPFKGGLVGYSSYDFGRLVAGLGLRDRTAAEALAHYIAPKSVIVFEHDRGEATLLHDGDYDEAAGFVREISAALRRIAEPPPMGRVAAPEANQTRAEFLERVERTKEHIRAGDVYQLVLSVGHSMECDIDPFEAYCALRRVNPSPYMFYLDMGGVRVAGSSPEALVKLTGGRACLRPIAGTRPRGDNEADDTRQSEALLSDTKERAEHVMLVDLARNDLGRCAAPGSVRVHPFMTVEHYSHVMHLVSGVEATLAAGVDAFDLFACAFPAGTLTGAPKRRAMELIDELEPEPRGLYGGAIGYFDKGGGMDHAISIRMLTFQSGRCSFQAGAGIVADSAPEREYQEIISKSAAMQRALQIAEERP